MTASSLSIGRYRIGERIAIGGMGEVRLAWQDGLGGYEKLLAIKLLLPHLAQDAAAVQGFLDEARIASAIDHPNVVRIFDVGAEAERYFLAMEFVNGVSLARLIDAVKHAERQVSLEVFLHVARSLCEALEHVHQLRGPDGRTLGLVHRDVTPHNVLLSIHGEVKLTDFGIAKARGSSSFTRPGQLKGKLAYLAPEQLEDDAPLDLRADLFGAGVTLFQLATGLSPFLRGSEASTLLAIRDAPLPDLRPLRPDFPPEIAAALERATARDPEARYTCARELRDALAPITRSDAAEALGEMVRGLCESDVARLEQQVRTVGLSRGNGETQGITATASRTRRRAGLMAGAAALSAGVLAFGYLAFAAGADSERAPEPLLIENGTAAIDAPVTEAGASAPAAAGGGAPNPSTSPAGERDELPASPASSQAGATQDAARVQPTPDRGPVDARPGPAVPRSAAAKPAPKVSAARAPGFLSVDAVPWAKVRIANKVVGETPISRFPVTPGTHRVELTNPETGRREVRKVSIASGRERRVRVDLR